MMEANLRTKKLKDIRINEEPYAKKDIHYKNQNETMNVFQIPLDCLIFNQHNGRIATFVKTYEKEHGPINANTNEGEELIAKFLWDSKENRNKTTQQDLREKGQLEYGIVTSDGVVIDGNRRFMLLKKIAKDNRNPTAYFKAIILQDTLESNPKEIMRLETTYQMGVDDKVDYSPIQKYLKCHDLTAEDFTEQEISKMMGEEVGDIKSHLSILALMDNYLETCGYEGLYRILESQKLEGHFVDLDNYQSRYTSGRKVQDMDWQPDTTDIDDLKNIYFDHMRAGYGVHDIRIIANPAKDKGFFTQQEIWENFASEHFEKVAAIKDDEKSLDKLREENSSMDSVPLILACDDDFRKKVGNDLKANLDITTRKLQDRNSQNAPLELLERAKNTLEAINPEVDTFNCPEVRDISHEIREKVEEFIRIVDGKG